MKRDLTSFLHSQLESERRARLLEQSYFKPDSSYFKLEAGRIERIDAEIQRRGQSFLDWLREQKADREQRGWLPEAAAWQQRIAEVEALLTDAGTSRLQARPSESPSRCCGWRKTTARPCAGQTETSPKLRKRQAACWQSGGRRDESETLAQQHRPRS